MNDISDVEFDSLITRAMNELPREYIQTVSYTHLDVYKRQEI